MLVPILKQGDYLIASIQAALSDTDLLRLRDDVVEQVGRYRSRGVIIDVTVLDVMDSFAVRTLSTLAQMITLRGAETVIVVSFDVPETTKAIKLRSVTWLGEIRTEKPFVEFSVPDFDKVPAYKPNN